MVHSTDGGVVHKRNFYFLLHTNCHFYFVDVFCVGRCFTLKIVDLFFDKI